VKNWTSYARLISTGLILLLLSACATTRTVSRPKVVPSPTVTPITEERILPSPTSIPTPTPTPQEIMTRGEGRALWIDCVQAHPTLASEEEIRQLVLRARVANFNTLIVQVNGRGEAFYNSEILPRAPVLKGKDNFDPLSFIINEAHRYGLELHVWINAYLVCRPEWGNAPPEHVVKKHPEWVLHDEEGSSLLDYNLEHLQELRRRGYLEGIYLEPGDLEVQNYLLLIYQEVVEKYDLDGVHLDYIRFPASNYGYGERSRQRFEELYGIDALILVNSRYQASEWLGGKKYQFLLQEWDRWRTQQVTDLVRRVYEVVKNTKSWVKVSAAVKPYALQARQQYFQDWQSWLREGIVDFIVPMSYFRRVDQVVSVLEEAIRYNNGRYIYAGLDITKINDPESLGQLILRVREYYPRGVRGIAVFSYNELSRSDFYLETLRLVCFPEPALVPVMPWKDRRPI